MLRHLLQSHAMIYISSHSEVFYKKVFLKVSQNSQENSCAEFFFSRNFNKNETLAQVIYSEFCEIDLTSKYKKADMSKCFLRKYICFVYF